MIGVAELFGQRKWLNTEKEGNEGNLTSLNGIFLSEDFEDSSWISEVEVVELHLL